MRRRAAREGWLFVLATGLAACGPAPASPAPRSAGSGWRDEGASLATSLRARWRALPAERRARLLGSPHRAYRLLAAESSRAACALVGDPRFVVQLHGDLHLGQVVLADGWLGLSDLDESVRGPVQVDLLRFATSLLLGGEHLGVRPAQRATETFLRAYASALSRGPEAASVEPPAFLRRRLEQAAGTGSEAERSAALRARLRPLADGEREAFLRAMATGCPALRGRPQAVGRIEAGVGSAALDKVLLLVPRQGGPRWLEAKETPSHPPAGCLRPEHRAEPDRVLWGLRAFGVGEPSTQCVFTFRGRRYTVARWALRYAELDPERDLRTPEELLAVARWVGERLGVVHGRQLPAPAARLALARAIERDAGRLLRAARRHATVLREALARLRSEGP